MKKALILLHLTLVSGYSFAEYRAYQYLVMNKVGPQDRSMASVVVSTLDPVTYISYNGGNGLVGVDLLRTWICPGYTGRKGICESPYSQLPSEVLP